MRKIQSVINPGKNSHGFTLVEIIAVLVVLGVLTAVVVSQVLSMDSYHLASEVGILKSNLRYAQSRAMSDNVSWGITFPDTLRYTLQKNGITATSNLPNENSPTHILQGGVTVSSTTDPVTFDVWGSNLGATIIITLSAGVDSQTITVTQNTGFIP